MSDSALLSEVERFAVEQLGLPIEQLSPEQSLLHDWRVTGLDGVEFMLAFAKKFGVDLSEFDLGRYFGDDPHPLHWLFAGKQFWAELKQFPRLTFLDLARAAEEGVWHDAPLVATREA